jgi:hypothetical protein
MSTNPASAFATLTLGTSPYHPYNLAYSHPQGAKLTAKEQMDARVQARLDYLHNNDKLNGHEQPVKGANNGGKDAGHGKNQQAGKSASVGRVVDRVVVKMFEAIGKAGSFGWGERQGTDGFERLLGKHKVHVLFYQRVTLSLEGF